MVEEIKLNETIKRDSITEFMLNFILLILISIVLNGLLWIILSFWWNKQNLNEYWNNIQGYEKSAFLLKIGLYTSLNYNLILLIILLY